MSAMNIPLLDLRREHDEISSIARNRLDAILAGMRLYLGENVTTFEAEFAAYCGTRYAIGVGSGTDALILALRALGIGPGDEVIVVSHTFIATVAAIVHAGARPVFVDVDPLTYTMDVHQVERCLTRHTRAILPVHLYGQPADMDPLRDLAAAHNLYLIEDACQAHGATYKGQRVGSLGDAAAFSFVFTKNLRCYGDAGMVVTNHEHVAEQVRLLRDHGRNGHYAHTLPGFCSRLDEIHAAVLRIKLGQLDAKNRRRRTIARRYDAALTRVVKTPHVAPHAGHVYHQYVIRSPKRDSLRAWLSDQGIQTGIHYPMPCHLQPACQDLGYPAGSLPATEAASKEVLSLPVFPELSDEEVEYIIDRVKTFETDQIQCVTASPAV
jgi:dTDP-4-amino-4,6-dideoxygalactose transaminase